MARLFIIDQSLCSPGGHHFDYVNCVARAAREDQLETFVATNRRFKLAHGVAKGQSPNQSDPFVDGKHDDGLHGNAKVVPSFRNTTYQKVSWLAGLRHLKRAAAVTKDVGQSAKGKQSMVRRVLGNHRSRSFKQKRRKIIAQFAADCSRFFGSVLDDGEFQSGDNVFLTTVSELEMMGLAIYLFNNPSSRNATWHLQFHFNLFDGRTPEFDSQSEVQRKVRGCFLAALSRVPDHDLKFFCTSEELVEQYSRLTVVEFCRLPYPVNQRFAPRRQTGSVSSFSTVSVLPFSDGVKTESGVEPGESDSANVSVLAQPSGPMRLVVPGELRREKGSANHLQNVVDDLWDDYLSSGRLQVAVQRPKRKLFRKEKLELQLPDSMNSIGGAPVVDYMRHPLSESDYCDFIRGSDFGLLLHDSRAYYSRRAGVLGELLSCGKPVIVPGGCWLAHQLQESQFQYIDSVMKQLPHSRGVGLRGLKFDTANAPLSGGVVSFDRRRHPFIGKCSKSENENIVVVSFDWQHPVTRGVDVRINCTESRSDGSHESATQVVGHRISTGKCQAMFRVDFGGGEICFEIENAYDDSTANIRNLSVDFFEALEPEHVPLGSFGLIYPDVESISASVAEMVEHIDHFRYRAEQFSHRWWNSHDPRRTLRYLVGEHGAGLKVA